MSITRLTVGSNITRQAITKHLLIMEKAGLVQGMRQGRESLWQVDLQRLDDAHHYLDVISKQWEAALGRLRRFVEE